MCSAALQDSSELLTHHSSPLIRKTSADSSKKLIVGDICKFWIEGVCPPYCFTPVCALQSFSARISTGYEDKDQCADNAVTFSRKKKAHVPKTQLLLDDINWEACGEGTLQHAVSIRKISVRLKLRRGLGDEPRVIPALAGASLCHGGWPVRAELAVGHRLL